MKSSKVVRLVASGTHCIFDDNKNYDLLRKVLKLAFPKDKITDVYDFTDDDEEFFGCDRIDKSQWANIGSFLQEMNPIHLSDIVDEDILPILKELSISNNELEFEKLVDETLLQIRETLIVKGKEYVRNNNPFHNFEVGARKKSITREKVLDGMMLKHEISIEDMTNDLDYGKIPSERSVNEKFGDNIIYLILKKAMFIDRILKSK